jgi:O-antigen/teichoic acid export membrane protein
VILIIAVAIPLSAGGIILGKSLIVLIFGSQYSDAGVALQILICYAALNLLNMIYARGLWACGKQRVYLMIVSIEALVNLIFGFLLIPSMGAVGAAVSILIVESIAIILHYWQLNKVVELSWSNHVIKPVLASALMLLLLVVGLRLGFSVIVLVGGGLLIYAASFCLVKGLTGEDLALIRNLIVRPQGQ